MANPLGGMFARPEEKRGPLAGFRDNVAMVGGMMLGITPPRIAEREAMNEQRQKAMARDAMTVYQLVNDGKVEDAISLTNRRISYIEQLGGDPSDTIQIRDLLSNPETLDIARQELGLFVQASMENGLLPVPERREPIRVGANDRLFDPVTMEEIVGAAPEQQRSTYGLSPVYLEDAEGNVRLAQPSSTGGVQMIDLPEGVRAMLPASQRAFNPNDIALQGQARTVVDVAREQAMRPELAQTAGAVTGAQQSAEIAAIAPRSEAERAATRAATQGQRIGAIESKEDQVSLLNDLTEQARDLSSGWTTGFIGGAAARIEGTPAYNLARTLDTLQATAGFDTLQEMRDNSPTGGALGQVTERELALLQATWGSLQQAQSKEQFDRALNRFQNQINNSWDRVNRAYERDYGQPYFVGGQQSNPDPLGILNGN